MKKHFVLIMNIVLAVLIIGALGFTTYRMFFSSEARCLHSCIYYYA